MSLEFKKIEVDSIQEMLPFYAMRHNMTCDSVFLESYVWKDYYNVRYAIWENKALLWLMENEGRCFSAMPLCREEDLPGAFAAIEEYFNEELGYPLVINLADEYINAEQRFGYWKDAAIRLEGAAVWNFTVMFLNVWNAFRPQETDYTAFAPTRLPAVQDGVVQPYADSPLDEEPLAETVYLDILSQAQRYVYIYTPYLAVGEEMLDALKSAAKRGVDVRLILPGIPDKKLVFRLSRSYYLPLLRAGVRIYEFTPGFLHAKCYVSDDRVAVVGSINMDYRSLFLHFECGTLLYHNSQIAALRKDVERTLPQCREVMRSDCRTNLPGTALDGVLRLLSPLM